MFRHTKFKLTAWYLAIIMLVSISFSMVIYTVLTRELTRFENTQRFRIERRLRDEFLPPDIHIWDPNNQIPLLDPELIEETKQRLALMLVIVNGCIFVLSGGLGYFLAGRTLQPIQDMIDEQNRFITDSSHELRTPLTSLKSTMEVSLRDKKFSLKDAKKLITENIQEVNKLQSLSDELLRLAQFEQPTESIGFENLNIADVIRNAIRKVKPLATKKDITVTNNVKDFTIEGSQFELSDLMVILLDNAIKYSPHKTSIIIDTQTTDGFVAVSVKDQGDGIEKKDIPHIFDRFYRSSFARTKTDAGGFGLGLSIAKRITDVHHGSISVESQIKKGSTFTVHLPIKQVSGRKQKYFS